MVFVDVAKDTAAIAFLKAPIGKIRKIDLPSDSIDRNDAISLKMLADKVAHAQSNDSLDYFTEWLAGAQE